jgi:hypothetical protein
VCSKLLSAQFFLWSKLLTLAFLFATASLMLASLSRSARISAYRPGRSPDWLKMKNPAAPAVKREAEEEWGK